MKILVILAKTIGKIVLPYALVAALRWCRDEGFKRDKAE